MRDVAQWLQLATELPRSERPVGPELWRLHRSGGTLVFERSQNGELVDRIDVSAERVARWVAAARRFLTERA